MDCLQYRKVNYEIDHWYDCFKPYYNWTAFNTSKEELQHDGSVKVLNLIITGIPSILKGHPGAVIKFVRF